MIDTDGARSHGEPAPQGEAVEELGPEPLEERSGFAAAGKGAP